jgi:hypothetical protein
MNEKSSGKNKNSRTDRGLGSEISRGCIRRDEIYTLSEFKLRLGVTDATLRAARSAGLPVYYVHKHAYINGSDWIDYVRSQGRSAQSRSE